jgi:hypothetical protein
MTKYTFEGELHHSGQPGTWTTLDIPPEVSASFETKQRFPVRITIGGHTFRSSAMPWGDGRFYLVINKEMQRAAGVGPGDTVTITLEPDDEPREVDVPEVLQARLNETPGAADGWNELPYSARKEYVDWILEAKREETRERRAQRAAERTARRERLRG